LNNQGQT